MQNYCCRAPFRLLGKASFCAGDFEVSGQAYDRASALQPETLAAWKGMVELYQKTNKRAKLVEAFAKLVSTAGLPVQQTSSKSSWSLKGRGCCSLSVAVGRWLHAAAAH